MPKPEAAPIVVRPPGEVQVKSPMGAVTTVPVSLVPVLLESGYTEVN